MGSVLLHEARALLDHADRVRVCVSTAAGASTLIIGILGDGTGPGVARLAAAHRRSRPGTDIRILDTDLTGPTCELRAGLVDVALTRAPFDETALTVRALRADPVGVVLRADDPPARRDGLRLAELSDRRWFQFPRAPTPSGSRTGTAAGHARAQWSAPSRNACRPCCGTARSACPLGHDLPAQVARIPLIDMPPSRVVAVWNEGDSNPLIRSFIEIATAAYRH
ncbi:LysR substrate-binding domain-containing protein [Streptomyces sp. NK15101]|uniref:LysR substrate-binding domain-containing protein n=1 Tax=Streptomyces sp. NK15101 TaxID=2873261 RepID=UPI001CEC1CB8|nr:LysR substrate-binding domain-containing protein [Streptomyces sp. NK15101]